MDCRESQTLLTAFHDGELPDADRARVDGHLRVCPDCAGLAAELARVDGAASVPDPGQGYWDRFNARLADRIGRKAEGPRAVVLRPKQGWMRQQLRYLVPAAAAAALVAAVVRFGGREPVAPAPTYPQAVSGKERAGSAPEERLLARTEIERPAAGITEGAPGPRRTPAESNLAAEAPAAPPQAVSRKPVPGPALENRDSLSDRLRTEGMEAPPSPPQAVSRERIPSPGPEDRGIPADRLRAMEKEAESKDRADAPAGIAAPSPPVASGYRVTADPPLPSAAAEERPPKARQERKKEAEAASAAMDPGLGADREPAAAMKAGRASSPCEAARTLFTRERLREAEAAQRECLAQDPSPLAQEKGLVFLAELLDRQARFDEADAVLAEVRRQFPESVPLTLYRQQRPMVQQQAPVPVTR